MITAYHIEKILPGCFLVLGGERVDFMQLPASQYPSMDLHTPNGLLWSSKRRPLDHWSPHLGLQVTINQICQASEVLGAVTGLKRLARKSPPASPESMPLQMRRECLGLPCSKEQIRSSQDLHGIS